MRRCVTNYRQLSGVESETRRGAQLDTHVRLDASADHTATNAATIQLHATKPHRHGWQADRGDERAGTFGRVATTVVDDELKL